MAATKYTYSVSGDTANGAVSSDSLATEIATSAIVIALDYIAVTGDVLDVWMKDALSGGDETILDGLVAAHTGVAPVVDPDPVTLSNISQTSDKFLKVTQEPREGQAINFYSPNMCNRTTWYEGCTQVSQFTLTDSGDHITYNTNGTHPGPWIDVYHGKIFNEDTLLAADPTLGVTVEVQFGGTGGWVEQTQNTFDDTDEDYSVDYDNGTITFNSALDASDIVRGSFSKAPESMIWTMKPSTGKRLKLMYAEIQMTIDVEMTDDIWYETWAYNPYDLPNKVMVFSFRYKTISDLLYESTGVYPKIPAFGGTGPRGTGNKDIIIFPFNYNAAKPLLDSQGVEVRIITNKVHTGTLSTTTLYCLEEDE